MVVCNICGKVIDFSNCISYHHTDTGETEYYCNGDCHNRYLEM